MKGIAILGWGSLIDDLRNLQDYTEGSWCNGGPKLPIEFSRVSSSRKGALTLVIDEECGIEIPTQFILSNRADPNDTACDLRVREGTVIRHIGLVDLKTNFARCRSDKVKKTIHDWAQKKNLRAVVWTDLPSNFQEETGNVFSVNNAVTYLSTLSGTVLHDAKSYIREAPIYVNTPLRQRLNNDGWLDTAS